MSLDRSEALGSLARTLLYMVIAVPLSIVGGLGLAVMLNQRLKAAGFFRTVFYVPSLVPMVATVIMWKLIFDRDAGALNAVLELFHIPTITWLVDPTAFYALIILMLWGMGGGMVISLAGLQGIPSELHEAAVVDGANRWQAFRRITLPMLSPVLFFQAVTGTITALQILVTLWSLLGLLRNKGVGQLQPFFLGLATEFRDSLLSWEEVILSSTRRGNRTAQQVRWYFAASSIARNCSILWKFTYVLCSVIAHHFFILREARFHIL